MALTAIDDLIKRYLACPNCHGSLIVRGGVPVCDQCHFTGAISDDVVCMMDIQDSYFDAPFASAECHENAYLATFRMQQQTVLAGILKPGTIICDVGCGRKLQYHKPADCFVIGIDPSASSIMSNKSVDLRVLGTAANLPLPSNSVDVVTCLYSMHHMVGNTIKENHRNVSNAFEECSRVLKKSGHLFIFEVHPWRIISFLQRIVWNYARRTVHSKLDMYLWTSRELRVIGSKILPSSTVSCEKFHVPALIMLAPFLALPNFRIPRFLIPVDVSVHHWQL